MKTAIKFKIRNVMLGLAVAALAGTASAAPAVWDGTLPEDGNPLTSQVYQDFTIYSLNYLSNLAASNTTVGSTYYGLLPSPTYDVASGVGQLQDYVVIGTGNTGTTSSNLDTCGNTGTNKDPVSGCDNSYQVSSTPATYFNSMMETEPDVPVPGEPTRSTWTATADALRAFLDGSDMVFMFNLNEDNGGDANTLDGQALLVSMRVELTDANGVPLAYFYVGANNAIGLPNTAAEAWGLYGAPDPTIGDTTVLDTKTLDPNSVNGWISTDPRWAYVHGAISVDATTGAFLAMGDCVYTGLANCKTISQNLGANQVAFSAFNQELSDLIADLSSGVAFMNVDVLTSGQSNGFEQLFIMAVDIPNKVPEPGSLALAGLALAAFGVTRRRRPSTKA